MIVDVLQQRIVVLASERAEGRRVLNSSRMLCKNRGASCAKKGRCSRFQKTVASCVEYSWDRRTSASSRQYVHILHFIDRSVDDP
jgi:hypothetical protein